MRNSGFLWIIIIVLVLLDFYVFQAMKVVSATLSPKIKTIIYSLYWLVSLAGLAILVFLPQVNAYFQKEFRTYLFALVVALFFSKLLASLFFIMDDVRRGSMWILEKLFSNPSVPVNQSSEGINRSVFLSWLGLGLGTSLFSSFIYGFTNKYRYQVRKVPVKLKNLPLAFKGLRAVHISDIHSGSFTDKFAVEEGINKILELQPDVIFFTGDLVNDHAHEMDEFRELFKRLQAPHGVFSILGNHDYGEYALPHGLNEAERIVKVKSNVEKLVLLHQELGWKLLMNEHAVISRNGQTIAVLGIENWSMKGNFPRYGKMEEAYAGTGSHPVKILLSHDPSHWEGEVRKLYSDIDLTLAGHTHGMQFGVELPGFKWSPVQYMYKQWAGLYKQEEQLLYVNRGFGFIGYPGRVGILPEITVLEFA